MAELPLLRPSLSLRHPTLLHLPRRRRRPPLRPRHRIWVLILQIWRTKTQIWRTRTQIRSFRLLSLDLVLVSMADEAKAKGNAAFSSGDFNSAIHHFSDAISLSPDNHVLYSNRSAAYASLHKYSEALTDAKKTVELKQDWSKGYSCLGAAHLGLDQHDDAIVAYRKGLEIDPNNEPLKSGLADAQARGF